MAQTYQFVVGPDEARLRIDRYLLGHLPGGFSRTVIQRAIREGAITIAGHVLKAHRRLRAGETVVAHVAGQINELIANEAGNGRLKTERELLAKALEDVQAMAASMTGYLMSAQEDSSSIYKVGLASVRFLMSVGDLVIAWLLQRQAAVAVAALDAGATGADRSFYEGKVAVASFFAKSFLPLLTSTRLVIETIDDVRWQVEPPRAEPAGQSGGWAPSFTNAPEARG